MRIYSGNWDGFGTMVPGERRRGRGAVSNAAGRFEAKRSEDFNDGWEREEEKSIKTQVFKDVPKKIISYNQSPDIPFDRSINPYRGCEHGCIYCFARPTHAYIGFSSGLDFETKLFAKPEAAKLLERELRNPNYQCQVLAIGTNTDPYQPIEREWRIMRHILEVLETFSHPVSIVTKSHLVTRDIDILGRMAEKNLAHVALSVTTLDHKLARKMEPRASTPKRRLAAIRELTEAGIPTSAMVAPVIPALNDHEIEAILETVSQHGARGAAFIFMRLPFEIKDLFREWLEENYPDRASRVINHIRASKGGGFNNPDFHERFKGHGEYAHLIRQRFNKACARLKLNDNIPPLDISLFQPPPMKGEQFNLFA